MIRSSSMVEHPTVNRQVVGSSPTCGVRRKASASTNIVYKFAPAYACSSLLRFNSFQSLNLQLIKRSMKRFQFKKLVRDKILESMLANPDQTPNYRILDSEEYITELKSKLVEEVAELQNAPADEVVEEIADIYEILNHLKKELNLSEQEIQTTIALKHKKVGGFEKKAYIEHNDVVDSSNWISKYQEQPHKYPEIELNE